MSLRRLRPAALAVAISLAAAAPGTAAIPASQLSAARLQGFFTASGTVTKALNVSGETVGEHVQRLWAFVPTCAGARCAVRLVRQRSQGYDRLVLHPFGPGLYKGNDSFYAPVNCAGRTIARGEKVPFTITVRITAVAAQPDGSVLVTGFRATYRNPSRTGLTRCFSPPSHDSATYVGATALSGSISNVRSIPSSAGS
jgi:hypothetical protein